MPRSLAAFVLSVSLLACERGPNPSATAMATGTVRMVVGVDPFLYEMVGEAGSPSPVGEASMLELIQSVRFVLETRRSTGDDVVDVQFEIRKDWWTYADTVPGGNGLRFIEKTNPVGVEFTDLAPGVYRLPTLSDARYWFWNLGLFGDTDFLDLLEVQLVTDLPNIGTYGDAFILEPDGFVEVEYLLTGKD